MHQLHMRFCQFQYDQEAIPKVHDYLRYVNNSFSDALFKFVFNIYACFTSLILEICNYSFHHLLFHWVFRQEMEYHLDQFLLHLLQVILHLEPKMLLINRWLQSRVFIIHPPAVMTIIIQVRYLIASIMLRSYIAT